MCSHFPLDYMHCALLGCMKKMLSIWWKGPLKTRLSRGQKETVSTTLVNMRDCISNDFVRRPRSVSDFELWKATEFRTFLLYTGCICLKGVLKPEYYKHFLSFCVSLRLLLIPSERNILNAEQLLDKFVGNFSDIYGTHTLVFNIHSLTHLSSDVKQHGSLEEISCFPFENYLYSLKKMIRGSKHVMQQTINRIKEKQATEIIESDELVVYPQLLRRHLNGPIPTGYSDYEQFSVVKLKDFTLNLKRDSCVQIGQRISVIKNILKFADETFVVSQTFSKLEDFFKRPIRSSTVGIYKVSSLSKRLYVDNVNCISKKCTLINYEKNAVTRTKTYIALTILHTV